jgi:hypothetical protein
MLSISRAFILYLAETAPSLFYQAPLDCISFRWKIPREEGLMGWTSAASGIDVIVELQTNEMCGIAGIHFPGMQFLEYLAGEHHGPYDALLAIERLQRYLKERNQTLGQHYEKMRHEANRASQNGCYLKYATEETPESAILTRQQLLIISQAGNRNLPRA